MCNSLTKRITLENVQSLVQLCTWKIKGRRAFLGAAVEECAAFDRKWELDDVLVSLVGRDHQACVAVSVRDLEVCAVLHQIAHHLLGECSL